MAMAFCIHDYSRVCFLVPKRKISTVEKNTCTGDMFAWFSFCEKSDCHVNYVEKYINLPKFLG
jgi:hypothetical protein